MRSISAAILGSLFVIACDVPLVTYDSPTVNKLVTNDIDVLLVIDNSLAMTDKQAAFVASLPALASAFDALPTGRPNLHVGVTSSSVSIGNSAFGANCTTGDDGRLQNTPRITSCSPPTGDYVIDIAGASGRTTNYTGTLDQVIGCISELGTTGCGFEAPLEGMARALDGSQPNNAGFLRQSSVLAILILTDEDDASVADPSVFDQSMTQAGPGDFRLQPLYAYSCDHPISASSGDTYNSCGVTTGSGSVLKDPARYVQFLASIKDPAATVVQMIAGPTATSIMTGAMTTPFTQSLALLPNCLATINGNANVARPGVRLGSFLSGFGSHGSFATACQSGYASALMSLVSMAALAAGPCIEGDVDTTDIDQTNPGLQLACTATNGSVSIPACKMTDATTPAANNQPCYWLGVEATTCASTSTHVAVHTFGQPTPPLSLACQAQQQM